MGARANTRPTGRTGLHRQSTQATREQALIDCVTLVAEKVGKMADSISVPVESLVHREVEKALQTTNESIAELKDLLLKKL